MPTTDLLAIADDLRSRAQELAIAAERSALLEEGARAALAFLGNGLRERPQVDAIVVKLRAALGEMEG